MKISIWRQFSSNHSADFTTVGQFESEEYATMVAQELRQMIHNIGEWWENHPDFKVTANRLRRDRVYLTPPEIKIKEEYDVDWCEQTSSIGSIDRPIDWISSPRQTETIQQYKSLVWLSPTGNTWCGSHPFDSIMEKLGGKVASSVEDFSLMTVDIAFLTPSLEIASELQNLLRVIERTPRNYIAIPGLGNAVPGELVILDNNFKISNLHLQWAGLKDNRLGSFMKIIDFLEANQCTGITYTFHQISIEEFYGE